MSLPLSRWIAVAAIATTLTGCSSDASDSMQGGPVSNGNTGGAGGTSPQGSGGQAGQAMTGGSGAGTGGSAATGGSSGSSDVDARVMDPMLDSGLTDGSSQSSDAASDGEAPIDIECPSDALEPGDEAHMLMHDGQQRSFLIHVPPSYDNTRPVPLVINFHGATSNAEQQRSLFSQMDVTSDAKGFIVVYPEGIGSSWNAGACCGEAASQGVDDVGFARALVEHMKSRACIDPKRIYAAGFSNGGRMSYRLGCEAADVFAAIAPVAGTKSFPDLNNTPGCMPSRPLSLIDFMGSADSRIAAQPGQIAEWVAFNGCTDAAPEEVYRNGEHYCMAYTACDAGTSVTYCVVDGGGHCWPGTTPCVLGATSTASELSANELMWELFERSSL